MSNSNALSSLTDKIRDGKRAFYSLQPREQNLITALSIVVIVALVYLLLMFPAQNSVESASKRLEAKQSLLSWMQANEGAAKAAAKMSSGSSSSGTKDILGAVNKAASRFQIRLQRYEPEGKEKLRVWLEDMSFNNTVRWLHQLESRNGITVSSISIDSEKETGLISAKIVLKK